MNTEEIKSILRDLFVKIPSGKIQMRDDRTKMQWDANIESFSLAKFPVTQRLYTSLLNHNPSTFIGINKPVETISWIDTVNFCNTLSNLFQLTPYYSIGKLENEHVSMNIEADGFRLPTEAEWEYACKAGLLKSVNDLDAVAWYKENSNRTTHDVGLKLPNEWGLYDMLGNVWEWCSDLYDTEIYCSYRIFRGGGWCDEARSVMPTTRRRSHPLKFKIDDLGFRIAINQNIERIFHESGTVRF